MSSETKMPPEEDGRARSASVDGSYFVNGPEKSKKTLPGWLDHFNAKDLKMLFKASLAVWIMTILIFIGPTLNAIGNAAFLGCIVLFIAPPSGVVFLNLLAGVTVCLGVCLGWAWGVITSKAALATRPQADLNARYAQLQQMIAQNTTAFGQPSGQTTYAQLAIFNGFMLDTRVTVTYYCMTGLFVYFMARLRVAAPKLTLVAIFGMIVADLYLTTIPLLPTFQGTVPKVFVIPVAIAVGVGVVCNLLIFPRSTASIIRDGMQKVLDPMPGFIEALDWHFKSPETRFDIGRLQRLKMDLVAAYKSIETFLTFLPMDFSYSSWSPEDIALLQEPLRQVLVTFGELSQVPLSLERSRIKGDALVEAINRLKVDEDAVDRIPVAYHQIARSLDLRQQNLHPETEKLSMRVLEVFSKYSSPLLQTWLQALEVIGCALLGQSAKARDSALHENPYPELIEALKTAQHEFQSSVIRLVFEEHSDLFDSNGNLISSGSQQPPILIPLMLGLLFHERITSLSGAILSLLEHVADIDTKRSKPCIWLPKGLRNLLSWGVSVDDVTRRRSASQVTARPLAIGEQGPQTSPGDATSTREKKDDTRAATLLENMRKPSGRQRSRASRILLAVIRWFGSDEGLHGLRTVVLTIGLACIAVVPSSAGFFYREKGLWAVIMGQVTIVPYASDYISSVIIRTVCTVVGGVLGLVCWYTGSGSGPGNPYGLAALMAVLIVVMMWWRLFAPPEQIMAGIMLIATIYLIVAFSWFDIHNPTYGDPGVGYTVFWRRLVLVLVGFAGSTLVMFFPRPPSGSRRHRQLFADSLCSIRDRYALFVSTWHEPPADLAEVIEKEAIVSDEILRPLIASTKLLRFEFSTSNINADTLGTVCDLCMDMNTHITKLVLSVGKLSPELRSHFMKVTGAGVESLFADLMAVIALVELSLVTGSPLPSVLQVPLLGRFLENRSQGVKEETRPDYVGLLSAQDVLTGEEGSQWISSIDALLRLLVSVDELVMVVKTAVGEGSGVDLAAFASNRV